MIYPEAYYAAHKEAATPDELGRIGFALVGRAEELKPPLTTAERLLAQTIIRCNKWHTENRDAIKEKWAEKKRRQRMSPDVPQCPRDNGGQAMSPDVPQCPRDNGGQAMSPTLSIYQSTNLSTNLPTNLSNKHNTNQSNINTESNTDTRSDGKKVGSESGLVVDVVDNSWAKGEMERLRKAMAADRSGGVIMSGEYDAGMICACLAGETRSNRLWRSYIRSRGEAAVLEECFTFYREMVAGEVPDNPGAALNSRLAKLPETKKDKGE